MSDRLTQEAVARREAARVRGRFGSQERTAPDTTLASDESETFGSILTVRLADKVGEEFWAQYRDANPARTPDEAGARAARFLYEYGIASTARVRDWMDSAYRTGLTGNGARPFGAESLVNPDDEERLVAELYGDGFDLDAAVRDHRTAELLPNLLAGAHRLGVAARDGQ